MQGKEDGCQNRNKKRILKPKKKGLTKIWIIITITFFWRKEKIYKQSKEKFSNQKLLKEFRKIWVDFESNFQVITI